MSIREAIRKLHGDDALRRPLQAGDVLGAVDQILDRIKILSEWMAALESREKELDERITALEGHGIRYAGTWQRSNSYGRGDVVTHQGSAWIALRSVAEGNGPGNNSYADWQLLVKAGRNGKDATP